MQTRLRYLYRAYRYRYRVDPAELRFLRDRLRPGQVAVDVGCHKGAYTYWMRRRVGPSGAVFAFEPQPRQVAYLRHLFDSMNYDNVVLVPTALSDRVGQLPLHVPSGNGKTHGATLEHGAWSMERGVKISGSGSPLPAPCSPLVVDVTTLDAFFADRPRGPDFLKIDVEGHESAVLAGARQTLERYRPRLLVECEARHRPDGDVRGVFDFLHSLGYAGTFFHNGQRRPLADFDRTVHQRIDRQSQHLPRGYVNNFAFEVGQGSRV
ncbi:MAG TPA: FkbM family methyltransferase [Lacipirellulaceae bacterium]|nr:FkbM family methyltransferase [Lacipirellulaceae bacterium]